MKRSKTLPITISVIILAAFLAISFLMYDASTMVYIAGEKGSYAETYAKDHNVDFIEIYDSDNPKVEIPNSKKEKKKNKKNKKAKKENINPQKQNTTFGYDYEGNTVDIKMYKGNDNIVIIPEKIDNLPVTAVSMNVVNSGITAVYIPSSVTKIDTKFTTPRYTPAFYTAITIMILGFIYALVSTFVGLKKDKTAEGTFYGIPFVYSGMITLIVITVISAISLLFNLSSLIQIIIAVIIFACSLGKLLKKSVARDMIKDRGEEVKVKTAFIKTLTVRADSLVNSAKSEEVKDIAKKVYEAIRYSDPMSTGRLAKIEEEIDNEFTVFKNAVDGDDKELADSSAQRLLNLIKDRNDICKLNK